MRYLTPYLQRDFQSKMILLSGPRQTGKTTLAKSLTGENGVYLNWDIPSDQRIIRNIGWKKGATLVALDELENTGRRQVDRLIEIERLKMVTVNGFVAY